MPHTGDEFPPSAGRSSPANTGSSSRYAQLLGSLEGAKPLGAVVKEIEPYAARLTARPECEVSFAEMPPASPCTAS